MSDRDAFISIFRAYDRRVYAAACRMVFNREDAADITQEVFYRAWRNFKNFDASRPVFPWLYRITKNLCINKSKKKSGSESSLEFPDLCRGRDSVEESAVRDESRREIYRAVMSLPPQHREIIILKHFDECSYEEIADILDIPKGTVMSRLYNARKLLKSKLEAEYEL